MQIANNFTQSLRKTIKRKCFLKTWVFPQNFPPDSQKRFDKRAGKNSSKLWTFGAQSPKENKETNYKIRKKLIERFSGDVAGGFEEHAGKISEIVFTQSPKTLRKISL